ncbi:MAG TPA: bacterial transcriptional activator domain-containing protein, partial [Acidimicrobiales bacterium]|nr:bacterial transcriptional activator domain-containing protein [Acidimicrobiales bacterium]
LDQGLPDVVAVELDQSSLRVVFAAPPPPSPPEPWTSDPERRLWELLLDDMDLEELRTLAGRIPAPLPALVSLGAHDHGAQVLFNLEGTGVTEIAAEAGRAEEVLAALALELTTCPWADFVDVVLVGFGDELEWLERARRAERMDDVVAALEHEAYGLAEVLDSSGWSNVVSARVQGPAADWVPTVVLCATGLDDVVEERLAKLSGEVRHAGVTVVVAGEVAEAAQRRLVVEGDRVRVEPLGLCARRERWLDADQLQSVVALLDLAGDSEDVAPAASTYEPTTGDLDELSFEVGEEAPEPGDDWSTGGAIDEDPANGHRPAPGQAVAGEAEEQALDTPAQGGHMLDEVGPSGQARPLSNGSRPLPAVPLRADRWLRDGEAPEVEVRVLGPVEVVGRGPVPRAKSLEAVVYLAMHRDGADSDRLRWALWPEGSERTTWDTTSSVARKWLGQASDGTLLLPKAYHNRGLFRLDELVGTDYERFRDAVALAEHLDGAAAVALLRSALELVRGRLFDGLVGKAHWVKYEGHDAELEAEIVDAALRMSELCLANGDVEAATWAAHRAQRVSPYDEGLTRALMTAADRAGNPAGVEAAWDDICAKVEADVEPYDQVHPETLALYQKLRRPSKTLV